MKTRAIGLIFAKDVSLVGVILFGMPLFMQCLHYGLTLILLCLPFISLLPHRSLQDLVWEHFSHL